MSKIGKKPILIPKEVKISDEDGVFVIAGPKGVLRVSVHPDVKLDIADSTIVFSIKKENKRTMALWGTMRALFANAIEGVTKGFEKKLELEGMGYAVKADGSSKLIFNLGFSHPVVFHIPEAINASVEKNTITIKGFSKELVGQTAAKIKALKPSEPYKGKGIRYQGEIIRKKAGKKAGAATAS